MRAAADFWFTNRQMIMHWSRETFLHVLNLSPRDLGMTLIYDVAHNIVNSRSTRWTGKR